MILDAQLRQRVSLNVGDQTQVDNWVMEPPQIDSRQWSLIQQNNTIEYHSDHTLAVELQPVATLIAGAQTRMENWVMELTIINSHQPQ